MAKENKSTRNSDNMTAGLCFLALFILLVLTALFSSTHPLDFMVNFLGTLTGYIFIIAGVMVLLGVLIYYWKLASDDPDKTLSEATRDNLEYSRDVTHDLSQKAKEFYAEYQERVKAAEQDKKNDSK